MAPLPTPASRLHRWVWLPVLGLAPTWLAGRRGGERWDDRAVADARAALRWQTLGAGVVLLHLALQAGILGVGWFVESVGTAPEPLRPLVGPLLVAVSVLNVASGLAEWGFVVFWGMRASQGAPLPFLGREPG